MAQLILVFVSLPGVLCSTLFCGFSLIVFAAFKSPWIRLHFNIDTSHQ